MRISRFAQATLLAGVAASLALGGCATTKSESGTKEAKGGLSIVATTGYLGDAVSNVAPAAEVTVLVKPGGDPHTQELTTKDSELIEKADLVVWTSHDMEHKMMDQLDKLGDKQLPAAEAIPESDLLPWEEDGVVEGHDPHVWNSPDNWKYVVSAIGDKLAELDKDNADTYQANAKKYNQQIDAAKAEAKTLFDTIPEESRYLVSAHDAFNYLGKTFNLEVLATDLVSTEGEKSAKELDDLAALIVEHKIPTIFKDNTASPQAVQSLKDKVAAKGGTVEVSDQDLYADSLGESAPVDTYLGVFKYNAQTISKALTANS